MPWRVEGIAEVGVGWGVPGAAALAQGVTCEVSYTKTGRPGRCSSRRPAKPQRCGRS